VSHPAPLDYQPSLGPRQAFLRWFVPAWGKRRANANGRIRSPLELEDEEPKTLKEIGERLGLTRERVRQIESEALSKLSESMQPD
jgi:hypothetical protein